MKKHISLLICLTAVLSLAACTDWLDVQPSTQTDRETLFSSEEGFSTAMKGIYSQMADESLYGRHLTWGLLDVFAGCYETNYNSPWNAARQYAYLKEDSYYDDELIGYVETYWTKLYNAIAGVNSILDEIDDREGVFTGDNYSVIKGEALGLRAFLHFEILRLYADVYEKSKTEEVMPYVNRFTPLVSPELTGEQVIGEVIADLKLAIGLLENDPMLLGAAPSKVLASAPTGDNLPENNIHAWHNRRFHFNYYATKATLARAYLWKGETGNALQTALEVIAHQETRFPWVRTNNLNAISDESSKVQDRTFATEHIFALNLMDVGNLIQGYHNTLSPSEQNYLYVHLDQFIGEDAGVDPRRRYLVTMNPTAGSYFPNKYYQGQNVFLYFRARLPLIRISEMYYIAAECSPDWQDGLEYLQEVRENRSIGGNAISVDSPETLHNEIYREYRKEFMAEGQLWHYYKRHQYTEIPSMWSFKGTRAYTFPRPEDEDLYGDRN